MRPISTEKQISQMWCCTPVVPATKAEAGGLLDPKRLRLQCVPVLQPGWTELDPVSKRYEYRLGVVAHACNPALWKAKAGGSRDRDHPCQHGETPSLLKIQKLARYGGAHL